MGGSGARMGSSFVSHDQKMGGSILNQTPISSSHLHPAGGFSLPVLPDPGPKLLQPLQLVLERWQWCRWNGGVPTSPYLVKTQQVITVFQLDMSHMSKDS